MNYSQKYKFPLTGYDRAFYLIIAHGRKGKRQCRGSGKVALFAPDITCRIGRGTIKIKNQLWGRWIAVPTGKYYKESKL